MKFLTLFLVAICLVSTSHAQPCIDSTAVAVDTLTLHRTLPYGFQSLGLEASEFGSGNDARWTVIVYKSPSGGTVEHVIDPASIIITGDTAAVNSMSAAQLFDLLAASTISQSTAYGHIPCPVPCDSTVDATVVLSACVSRTTIGNQVTFDACIPSGCCIRRYSVCCPNESTTPLVTLISTESWGCGGPPSQQSATCEPSCN